MLRSWRTIRRRQCLRQLLSYDALSAGNRGRGKCRCRRVCFCRLALVCRVPRQRHGLGFRSGYLGLERDGSFPFGGGSRGVVRRTGSRILSRGFGSRKLVLRCRGTGVLVRRIAGQSLTRYAFKDAGNLIDRIVSQTVGGRLNITGCHHGRILPRGGVQVVGRMFGGLVRDCSEQGHCPQGVRGKHDPRLERFKLELAFDLFRVLFQKLL